MICLSGQSKPVNHFFRILRHFSLFQIPPGWNWWTALTTGSLIPSNQDPEPPKPSIRKFCQIHDIMFLLVRMKRGCSANCFSISPNP